MVDYELFLRLTRDIPDGLDRSVKKEKTTPDARTAVSRRDKKTCRVCGLKGEYGNPGWDIPGKLAVHHIIPNGPSTLENLITLCRYCHAAVHFLLYAAGKWRYVPAR